MRKSGNAAVHFTVYEPDYDPSGEYCSDVPKAGPMIVVFDLVDQELRRLPFDLEIVRTSGGARETVHHVEARTYPNGVINAELEIPASGRYAAVLTPEGKAPIVFPMRVEIPRRIWIWLVPLIALAPLLYYWSQRRTPRAGRRRSFAVVK